MKQHAKEMICALSLTLALAATASAQVTATVELTASSFTIYEPVFVGVHVANAGSQDVQAAMGYGRLAVEQQDGNGAWVAVDLFDGIAVSEDLPYGPGQGWTVVPATGNAWWELLIRQPSVYATPGNYRVQLRTTIVDASETRTDQASPWVTFSITADDMTAAVLEADGVLTAYEGLFAGDFGQGEILLTSFDLSPLKTITSSTVAPGVWQFVDLLRAQALITESGKQTTQAAVIQKLDEAIAVLGKIDTGMYGGSVGGVGSRAMYTRAWADWWKADTLTAFDAATAEYQAIVTTYPAALLAVACTDWSPLRALQH
jgi:hypothetical protein